jgi:hypothetical protein
MLNKYLDLVNSSAQLQPGQIELNGKRVAVQIDVERELLCMQFGLVDILRSSLKTKLSKSRSLS